MRVRFPPAPPSAGHQISVVSGEIFEAFFYFERNFGWVLYYGVALSFFVMDERKENLVAVADATDASLVARSLRDHEAFVVLVERYEATLLRYVRRFTGLGRECAEDVMQEVFLKIYRNLNGFDAGLPFSSWAYRIAHNEAVNYLKKHRGKEAVALENEEAAAIAGSATGTGSLLDVLEADVDIVGEAARGELRAAVRGVLARLPQKYREVLVLRYLEEKDYNEIGDILKKPAGTVATWLKRAKDEFRREAMAHNLHFLRFVYE